MRSSLLLLAVLSACGPDALIAEGGDDADALSEPLSSTERRSRARRYLASAVLARMHMPNGKTAGDRTPQQVARMLSRARPSMVTGLIRIDADPNLDDNASAFGDYRAVRDLMPGVPFDVVLNACDYAGPEPLIAQMKAINGRVGTSRKPEAWFFDFYDAPLHDRDRPCLARGPGARAMLQKVADWAHRHDQLMGGNVWSASDLPPDSDFFSVPDEQGREHTLDLVSRLPPDVMRTVHVENNPQKCIGDDPRNPTTEACRGSSGDTYIWRRSPQDRESYDRSFLDSEDRRGGYRYLRPVLFPLSNHLAGGGPQAFDRDANLAPSQLPYVESR